jgi:hypothetical protein
MDNLNEKLSNEAESQPSCLGAAMRSAYFVKLQGGNTIIVIADSVSEVCDKMEVSEFSTVEYKIEHDKTMLAVV